MGWKKEGKKREGDRCEAPKSGLVYLRYERGAYGHSCVFENTKRRFAGYYELFYL